MESNQEPGYFSLPDLHEFAEGSLPSPEGLMHPVRRLPPGLRLLAIGWLDGPREFPTGDTQPEVVPRLLGLDAAFLIDEGSRGYHACYYCGRAPRSTQDFGRLRGKRRPWDSRPQSPYGKGHSLVRLGDVVYMFPSLLPHYIVVHGYRPPDGFQAAVLSGVFLADRDLIHTGEDVVELELRRSLAAAVERGDAERANEYRARIEARREELRLAGRTAGFRDRDTGVWRDR